MARTVTDKYKGLHGKPISEWPNRFFKRWNPKRDFAYAMLHAERLTRLLADVAIAEILHEQARRFPERTDLLAAWLDRAEPRCRFLSDEITTTGDRLLRKLGRVSDASAGSSAIG
jgi:hypothetical protein